LISASTLLTCSCRRRRRGGEQLGLGDQLQRRLAVLDPDEALGQRRGEQRELFVAFKELGEGLDRGRVKLVLAQQVEQGLAPAFTFCEQQRAVGRVVQVAAKTGQRLLRVALDADVGQRPRVVDRLVAAHGQHGKG
jgi:hypothetical protein